MDSSHVRFEQGKSIPTKGKRKRSKKKTHWSIAYAEWVLSLDLKVSLIRYAYFIFMRFARPLGKYPIVHKSSYTQIYSLCVVRNSFHSLLTP